MFTYLLAYPTDLFEFPFAVATAECNSNVSTYNNKLQRWLWPVTIATNGRSGSLFCPWPHFCPLEHVTGMTFSFRREFGCNHNYTAAASGMATRYKRNVSVVRTMQTARAGWVGPTRQRVAVNPSESEEARFERTGSRWCCSRHASARWRASLSWCGLISRLTTRRASVTSSPPSAAITSHM